MSEEQANKPKAKSPVPAWVFYLVVGGYAPMFLALNNSYEKRDKANERTIQIQGDNLQMEREANANERRVNEMLTRMLYTSEKMEKFAYSDSLLTVIRNAASDRLQPERAKRGEDGANDRGSKTSL